MLEKTRSSGIIKTTFLSTDFITVKYLSKTCSERLFSFDFFHRGFEGLDVKLKFSLCENDRDRGKKNERFGGLWNSLSCCCGVSYCDFPQTETRTPSKDSSAQLLPGIVAVFWPSRTHTFAHFCTPKCRAPHSTYSK